MSEKAVTIEEVEQLLKRIERSINFRFDVISSRLDAIERQLNDRAHRFDRIGDDVGEIRCTLVAHKAQLSALEKAHNQRV